MRCASCLSDNPDGSAVCSRCGELLRAVCTSCRASLQPGGRFCHACGTQVAAPPAPDDAERRQVTVLFCDLVDSTVLAERLEPEDLRDLVRSYHELCARTLESHAGHLAQVLGDGVLAYFGYPIAQEHDATSAVRAGLAIARAVEEAPAPPGTRLRVRVGIHSGLVVAGEMGAGQQRTPLPVGSAVNVAARLQGLARPGRVVISEATERLTRGFFECRDLGSPELKGISRRLRVYEVRGASGAESSIEARLATGLTPLVGRDAERDVLLRRWEHAEAGAAHAVFMSGEAGLGKSRLLQELKGHLSDRLHHTLECRCSPHHQSCALHPAIDLLQRSWRLHEMDDGQARFERIEQALAPLAEDVPDAVPLVASLLSVPLPERIRPVELTPRGQRQRTLDVLVAIALEMARERPLLLVVEDLHWIDPTSLDFLALLFERAQGYRILLLLLFRPSFEPPWRGPLAVTEIALERLGRDEGAGLIRSVAGGRDLPAPVVEALYRKADGIPLYLEELTKMVLESGQLREGPGSYELAAPLARLEIPATLQESLMARLDRVAADKEILRVGATIGRSFSHELLRIVTQLDAATLEAELAELVHAEILFVHGEPPDATYVFKHALIQEAAYEGLLRHRRRHHHRRIAEILKSHFPDVVEMQPELLGHHWAEAGETSEAVGCYRLAGRRSLELSADLEAASHLHRALELLDELEPGSERNRRELELRIDLGAALVAVKGNAAPEIAELYASARGLCDQLGEDTHQLFDALSGIFLFHQTRGDLGTALDLTHQRRQLAERLGDAGLLMRVHENLGTVAFWRGEFEASLAALERALALHDEERARDLQIVYGTDSRVVCHTYAAHALWFLGHPDRALERCEVSLRHAREDGHANSLGLALAFAAALHHLRREPLRTQALADEAVAFSTEQHLSLYRGFGMIFQGVARAAQGEGQRGIDRMLEGVASFQQTGAGLGGPLCLALLADAHREAGRCDEGLALLHGGLELLGDYEDVFFDAEVVRVRGCLLLETAQGGPGAAEPCFVAALERARAQGARMLELRAATSLARLHQRGGEPERARAILHGVYEDFREGLDTADLRDAAALLTELGAA